MRIVNELGNTIRIEVTKKDIEGVPGLLLVMLGPDSVTENHITLKEAEALCEELREALGK